MKNNNILKIGILFILSIAVSNSAAKPKDISWLKNALNRSQEQLSLAAEKFNNSASNPRSFENGNVNFAGVKDWTCGFFPGSLWYMYELTKNEKFKNEAEYFTSLIEPVQYRKDTHDLGFMLYCSYGNGYRLTGNESYKQVLITGANSLMTRFHPEVGLIKSWDNRKTWQYPVIIDNMMNLEFLCEVGKITNENSLKEVSISHANKTMANHFRENSSCFHVLNYDSISGKVISKETHQGFSNSSSWARGQGWALYGYTMMYRETKNPKYLEQAQKVAAFILNNPNLPKDKVPYWDFNAPKIPNEPRDASAAAIYASALLELSGFVKDGKPYFDAAEQILVSLSSAEYLSEKGENGLFILKHSTGNWPAKKEIDVPLNYADYYFIEALGRYMKAKGISIN
jgi:rhamnogalacturonyl hydrolase YesR